MNLKDHIPNWTEGQKAAFLEFLSQEITLAIRAMMVEAGLTPEQRLEEIDWLNEIHHRVPMRARGLRRQGPDWIGPDLGLDLSRYAAEERKAAEFLRMGIQRSIELTENEAAPTSKRTVP